MKSVYYRVGTAVPALKTTRNPDSRREEPIEVAVELSNGEWMLYEMLNKIERALRNG